MTKPQEYTYTTTVVWMGNHGQGTAAYDAYARDYEVFCEGKETIRGSADSRYPGGARGL